MFNAPWKGQCELPQDHWIYKQAQGDAPPVPATILKLLQGDYLAFDSTLVHCTHPPTTKNITGRLRRLCVKIAMQPTAARCALERTAKEVLRSELFEF